MRGSAVSAAARPTISVPPKAKAGDVSRGDRHKQGRLTSYDENSAETLEVGESTGVVPVLGTEVALITDTTAVDDDAEDDEAQTSSDLDG